MKKICKISNGGYFDLLREAPPVLSVSGFWELFYGGVKCGGDCSDNLGVGRKCKFRDVFVDVFEICAVLLVTLPDQTLCVFNLKNGTIKFITSINRFSFVDSLLCNLFPMQAVLFSGINGNRVSSS